MGIWISQGAAIGALTSAWDFGLALGGPLGGLAAGQDYVGPFWVAGMTTAFAAVPLLGSKDRRLTRI